MIPEKECLRHVNVTMHFNLTRSNEEHHLAREPLEVLNSLGYPYFEKKNAKTSSVEGSNETPRALVMNSG